MEPPRDSAETTPAFPSPAGWLSPHFVGGMIPRPMHIQGKIRQGIEPFDFRRQKVVNRVADTGWFAHDFTSESVLDRIVIRRFCPIITNPCHNLLAASHGRCKGCLTVLGGHGQAQRFPWGKPWDRQPISGKLRRKFGVSAGFAVYFGTPRPKRLSTPM